MRYAEASELKKGDLVVVSDGRGGYGGLVFEIESIEPPYEPWCRRVTLKQPGFDGGFRKSNCDTRLLKRYEP